jgi:hypothetical protein
MKEMFVARLGSAVRVNRESIRCSVMQGVTPHQRGRHLGPASFDMPRFADRLSVDWLSLITATALLFMSTLGASAAERGNGVELSRRLRADAAQGYRHMTIQRYVQDKPLPGTKVAIPAHIADTATIVDNGRVYMINGVQPHAAARTKANIVLGTAPEEVQTKVLRCLRNALMHLPCAMMVLGTVDVCEGIQLGVRKTFPCIAVDSAWSLAEVGTYTQAIELKIDLPPSK